MGNRYNYESDDIRDPRSTGRKRARRTLLKLVASGDREYCCADCGHVPSIPWNVPSRSGDILDANHKNKNWLDNDPSNLEFLCRKCHLKHDRVTGKGENPVVEQESELRGYGDLDDD